MSKYEKFYQQWPCKIWRINMVVTDLGRAVNMANRLLNGAGWPIRIPYVKHTDPLDETEIIGQSYLGFQKVDGSYQIAISEFDPVTGKQANWHRWEDSSRWSKIRSYEKLDQLFKMVVEEAEVLDHECRRHVAQTLPYNTLGPKRYCRVCIIDVSNFCRFMQLNSNSFNKGDLFTVEDREAIELEMRGYVEILYRFDPKDYFNESLDKFPHRKKTYSGEKYEVPSEDDLRDSIKRDDNFRAFLNSHPDALDYDEVSEKWEKLTPEEQLNYTPENQG